MQVFARGAGQRSEAFGPAHSAPAKKLSRVVLVGTEGTPAVPPRRPPFSLRVEFALRSGERANVNFEKGEHHEHLHR